MCAEMPNCRGKDVGGAKKSEGIKLACGGDGKESNRQRREIEKIEAYRESKVRWPFCTGKELYKEREPGCGEADQPTNRATTKKWIPFAWRATNMLVTVPEWYERKRLCNRKTIDINWKKKLKEKRSISKFILRKERKNFPSKKMTIEIQVTSSFDNN